MIARGKTIVVTSNSGVWRSTTGGTSFIPQSGGLPKGPATSLVGDGAHPQRLWVAITGPGGGVFHSEDQGQTWNIYHDAALQSIATTAKRLKLAEGSYSGGRFVVYVAVIDQARNVPALFRITTQGGTDQSTEFTILPAFETASQSKVSLAADPLDASQFFVAGDEGELFRCHAFPVPVSVPFCFPISDKHLLFATANGTSPHADSRAIVFDTNDDLVETDDGGIYERTSPRTLSGDWFSRTETLR